MLRERARCYKSRAVQNVEEYRRHAADCDELARTAPDEKQREQIKSIAETWRRRTRPIVGDPHPARHG
jgi:hypothetical protein